MSGPGLSKSVRKILSEGKGSRSLRLLELAVSTAINPWEAIARLTSKPAFLQNEPKRKDGNGD